MRMYVISDNVDTTTGLRLAGIDGVVVHEKNELKKALDAVLSDPEIGILLLTEKLEKEFPEMIRDVRLTRRTPLVIAIPDRHGTGRSKDFITSYVNEAIGVKL